jgi:PAS domain S-box-containing protein
VGATCLARLEAGKWRIEKLCDRVGLGLQVGGDLPFSDVYGQFLGQGVSSLIADDIRADFRFAGRDGSPTWPVGALTAVPLTCGDGRPYGALCTLHPAARRVLGGELPLLELAGRMLMQVVELVAMHERERARARQLSRYVAIVDATDDAVLGTDATGRIEVVNPGAARMYGYSTAEVIGQFTTLLAPLESKAETASLVRRVVQGEHLARYRTVRRRKDGTLLDVALTLSPIRAENGAVIGVSEVARDLTDMVKAKRESERARCAAEDLGRRP